MKRTYTMKELHPAYTPEVEEAVRVLAEFAVKENMDFRITVAGRTRVWEVNAEIYLEKNPRL